MRKRIELEYIFSSSVNVLFSRLSTPMGLAEWFADDVKYKDNTFIFMWDGVASRAELVELKRNLSIKFRWENADDDEYFEFFLRLEPLTSELALIITDFVDEEEEEDTVKLWNKQIEMLHRTIGA
ncbi:MAG: SRPBCC domain-containing protein [Odoribacteraceae bacterium]|nr:SRPBCC domain-containing protein [Odoribacteraceae bacterium]